MQLHPLFQNALHAPRPCFIRNPTGIIIHNFPIYSNSHAEYNIIIHFKLPIIILCVCVCVFACMLQFSV